MYKIPEKLEKTLLSYTKKTYLPDRRVNPKTADGFAYAQTECAPTESNADFDQTVPENDGFFNQDISW